MKSLQAQFSSCQPLMLCTAPASTKTCGAITSAVLIKIWHLMFLTLLKNKPKHEQEELKHSFQVPGFSVSVDCHNYGHDVLGDWSRENNKKSKLMLFSPHFALFATCTYP